MEQMYLRPAQSQVQTPEITEEKESQETLKERPITVTSSLNILFLCNSGSPMNWVFAESCFLQKIWWSVTLHERFENMTPYMSICSENTHHFRIASRTYRTFSFYEALGPVSNKDATSGRPATLTDALGWTWSLFPFVCKWPAWGPCVWWH